MLQKFADSIDAMNEWLGNVFSWLTLGMVIMTGVNIIERYVFQSGMPWESELVRYMYGITFLGAAGYTLKHNAHVRVDVLYERRGPRFRAWVDMLGSLFLLFPVCAAIIYFSWDFVLGSWALHEGSTEYMGMPGVFIFKTFIWVFSATLILQALAISIRSLGVLRGGKA